MDFLEVAQKCQAVFTSEATKMAKHARKVKF